MGGEQKEKIYRERKAGRLNRVKPTLKCPVFFFSYLQVYSSSGTPRIAPVTTLRLLSNHEEPL